MPNWCYNSLAVEGDPALIADMKRQLNKPFVKSHDSWNMTTGQMEISETSFSNPVFAFHNIFNHIQDGVSDEQYIKQPDFKQPLEESLMFMGNHWYDWNVRNWGTKWDVAVRDNDEYPETEIIDEVDNAIAYKFNTAWSPPFPAIEKLSEQYPSLHFNMHYEEETGWGGEVEFHAGAMTVVEDYENKCRDCDSINCMEYCDNDCGEICNECHYLGEADLECVAECDTHKVYLDDDHVPEYRRVEG